MLDKIYKNYNKIILYSIFVLPFFDIYRALVGNKFELFGISFVEIFNFIFTFFLFAMLFYKCIRENKKIFTWKFIILVILYLIYIFFHCKYIISLADVKYINYNMSIFKEVYYIFRAYVLPLIILFVYMRSQLKSKDIIAILSKLSFIFSLIIVITNIFGIALVAYSSSYEGIVRIKGNIFTWFTSFDVNSVDLYTSRGLFYSTNQISAILGGLLFVSSFYTLYKDKISYYLSYFVKILAAIMLSTKTAFFAIILSIIAIYVYSLIMYIVNKERTLTKKSFIFLLYLAIIMFIFSFSPIKYKLDGYVSNLKNDEINQFVDTGDSKSCLNNKAIELENKYNISLQTLMKENEIENYEKDYLVEYMNDCPKKFEIPESYIKFYPIRENFDFWFNIVKEPVSELTNYRKFKEKIYMDYVEKHNDKKDKWLGIGYSSEFPYLEVDFVGQNVWFGYIGMVLFLFPYVFILLYCLFIILLNIKKKLTIFSTSLALTTSFMIFVSLFAGHVFGIILPSTILALSLAGLYDSVRNSDVSNNKMSFLLLHLGYGGIESSTINTANSLCDKYDIEIMSFYKLDKNQANKLNDKIKIKYLYDGGPNKEEFLNAMHKHKFIKALKEGIKASDILIKKKIKIIKYIINCDAKYIISTRWDFSILLSRYGNNYSVKIAQEHHYHNNNNKYINVLKYKYNNIDYLFALTKTLEKDYKDFLKGNNDHTKVVLMPNMLYEIPNKESKLKDKNIITVSRLDEGKKIDDIIRAFSKLKEKDWKLYVIGDGKEYNNLNSLIDELELKDRVILTGYKNKEEIEKYMLESSLFLMASVSEGLPMVLLEAMSYGIPCIAYHTDSGTDDIIKDNKNGYIINNRNEKEYINKIEKVIKDDKLRIKLGKEAKSTAYDFSKEKITEKWLKILNK